MVVCRLVAGVMGGWSDWFCGYDCTFSFSFLVLACFCVLYFDIVRVGDWFGLKLCLLG